MRLRKNARKNKDDLAERWKLGTYTIYNNNIVILFAKELIQNLYFSSRYGMSNFHDFDEDQLSWKFAQR